MRATRDVPECRHLWNSEIGVAPRVVECDWCVMCSETRPGFKDPREKYDDDEP
jgi:hypothetical protein